MSAATDTITDDRKIVVTERAASEFQHIIDQKGLPPQTGMRLSVKGGGCSGFEYQIDLERNEADEFDIEFDFHGVRVVIDMKSEFYMGGTTIDFSESLMERSFTFQNPQASGTCGCGSSFSI